MRSFRFQTKHLLVLAGLAATFFALPFVGVSHATVCIDDVHDYPGSMLAVSYYSDYETGSCGGFVMVPSKIKADRASELIGKKWTTRFRPNKFLWLEPNHHAKIKTEIIAAIDEIESR